MPKAASKVIAVVYRAGSQVYHASPLCAGVQGARVTTLETAQKREMRECRVCWRDTGYTVQEAK